VKEEGGGTEDREREAGEGGEMKIKPGGGKADKGRQTVQGEIQDGKPDTGGTHHVHFGVHLLGGGGLGWDWGDG
jgi:hypothetical protein